MKQPRAVYHVATSLPNRQSSPPSLRCVQRGWRILLYSHHYTCFIENFFSFLKENRAENKRILFCDLQSHAVAHFPQPQWATCPHKTLRITGRQADFGDMQRAVVKGMGLHFRQSRCLRWVLECQMSRGIPNRLRKYSSLLPGNTGLTECRSQTASGESSETGNSLRESPPSTT